MIPGYININDYDYDLPADRIAQYPAKERDSSRLLIVKKDKISQDIFTNIGEYLPEGSLLVFNNSKVIRARLLFGKETGARIEIFCIEPVEPVDYERSLSAKGQVEWKCLVGNLKKWKKGILNITFDYKGEKAKLEAVKIAPEDAESWRIRFRWDADCSFYEVLEGAGHIPLPPYITRSDEPSDSLSYQTVYSRIRGSVAAPTAGLHFTDSVLNKIQKKNIETAEVTLHVGAGTFQPVKVENASEHEMHYERFLITENTLLKLIRFSNNIIPVGTTSVRTLESLYWLGIKLLNKNLSLTTELCIKQWETYQINTDVSVNEALNAILLFMKEKNVVSLTVYTGIMIVPGYIFRITKGIVTNFHQPRSTLLLLVSAWTGEKWKEAYRYAAENNFRFLSYGDSSLLLP